MGKHLSDEAVEAVLNMKDAITRSQRHLGEAGLELAKVELELETVLTKSAGGALKLKVVEVGAHRTRADVQTLRLDLTPTPTPPLEPMGASLAEGLQQAIVAAAAASAEAADTKPRFVLTQAVVTLEVAIAKDGKVSVFVEGGVEKEGTHTLKLTLKPTNG